VEQVTNLITQKLGMMIQADDHQPLLSKRKALTALLPYAILQERDRHPEMLDAYLHAVRTSMEPNFTWRHAREHVDGLFQKTSPRAMVLMTTVWWDWLPDAGDVVGRWAAAASAISDTEDEEVVRSVVDMLLQIASECWLLPYIPTETWSWLTKRPDLPSVYLGRRVGTCAHVVKAVRALKDIEILKSYFLLVWSHLRPLGSSGCRLGCPPLYTIPDSILNRHPPDIPDDMLSSYLSGGFYEMWVSIQEDFGGIEMEDHRTVFLNTLYLDIWLDDVRYRPPGFDESDLERVKYQYQTLRETLRETNIKAITRTSHLTTAPLHLLTPAPDGHRIPCNIYVRTPFPVPVVSQLQRRYPHSLLFFVSLRPTRCVSFGHSSCHL
jgi:hypothetical protein